MDLGEVRRGSEYDQNVLHEMFKELKKQWEKKNPQQTKWNCQWWRISQTLKPTNKGCASIQPHKSHLFCRISLASCSGSLRGIQEVNSHRGPQVHQALPVSLRSEVSTSGHILGRQKLRFSGWGVSRKKNFFLKNHITRKSLSCTSKSVFAPRGHTSLHASHTCLCLDCECWFPGTVCTLWHSTKKWCSSPPTFFQTHSPNLKNVPARPRGFWNLFLATFCCANPTFRY